ncbi:hypothetical protein HDU87_002004 [Geranomyces variabilis]|uniref:F-box domain-containing protein n=1 Tax=Geranomyces variabilis TaxID=109894 RepID=A0AAD5TNN7_9FUNG|nr:hypothetical protein HDU87_002004 [Geranomyces variabilis]
MPATGNGVPTPKTAEKIDAAHAAAKATDELSDALTRLSLTRAPRRVVMTDDALNKILRWLPPLEYHVVAPLVSKQWRRCIRRATNGRGWKSRVVLLNLRILLPDHAAETLSQADDGSELPKPKILITHPAPLNYWTVLPEEFCEATQTRMAGEGISVQTTLRKAPRDPERVREFLNGVLAMLIRRVRWWCERTDALEPSGDKVGSSVRSDEEGDGDSDEEDARLANAPNISLIPWQVTLVGSGKQAGNVDELSDLLAGFAPRVVELSQPPTNILDHLVTANAPIHILKLTGVGWDDMPNLARIGQFRDLRCLELSGRPVADQPPLAPAEDALVNHLLPLAELAGTLRELRIGCGYPIPTDKFRSFVQQVLVKLTSLRILYVDKLVQQKPTGAALSGTAAVTVGAEPALLAQLIYLPNLTELYCLKDLTPEFFAAVGPPPNPVPELRTLSVFYELLTTPEDLHAVLVLFAKHFPYLNRLSLNLNKSLSARQVLDVLAPAKQWLGLEWKHVVVEQIPMGVHDIALWGRLNLGDSRGFGIRWKGVR